MVADYISRFIIQVPAFLLALTIHEFAHAYVAHRFGDDTAKRYGRLTINPLPHLDLMGSIVFPILFGITGGVFFGWAKPVPIDPRRFSNIRSGVFWVSFAGPLSNILLAVACYFFVAFMAAIVTPGFFLFAPFLLFFKQLAMICVVLAIFNLLPVPPLDGSKMVSSFLNYNAMRRYESLGRYSLLFFALFMFTGVFGYIIRPFIYAGDLLIGMFYNMMV